MIALIDNRPIVQKAYEINFLSCGVKLNCFSEVDILEWIKTLDPQTLESIDAFLVGQCESHPLSISQELVKLGSPVIIMLDMVRLDEVIGFFEAGVDDVIRKPMNIKEILCRINACRKRRRHSISQNVATDFQIFCNGRDAIVGGRPLELPRRERRLLEYFAANMRKRVTKGQIFNAIYGIFEEDICESVVESHVSKLRKKLRSRLGYDPIESKRFLGYKFDLRGNTKFNNNYEIDSDLQVLMQSANIREVSDISVRNKEISIR
jgi:DNA-binding winged helix-turn-helix (wHTH) protein